MSLHDLLPAIYRVRDAEVDPAHPPLSALLSILDEPVALLEEDIQRLYDNWFIETCDEPVATALGALLGVRPLHAVAGIAGPRAYVANTIGYRRRKGTAAVVEQLALDVTGWPARAVEFFTRLATTQYLNHVRPDAAGWATVRGATALELLGGAFETATHTAVAGSPARGRRYAVRTVGLFLWRLTAFGVVRGTARPVTDPPDGGYHVNPLGLDAPLFNPRRREDEITHLARENEVPAPLRRRPLFDELAALRAALATGAPPPVPVWFGDDPVLRLFLDGAETPAAKLAVCDLSTWRRPDDPGIAAAVDPVLGRIALPTGTVPDTVQISYRYGFSGRLGGGPYERGAGPDNPDWSFAIGGDSPHRTFGEAVLAWQAQPPGTVGVIAVGDSASYREDVVVTVPEGSRLYLTAEDVRPHLRGSLTATGDLSLSGLLVEGDLTATDLRTLDLSHCTIRGTVRTTTPAAQNLTVTLDRVITADVAVTGEADVRLSDCVVDGDLSAGDADIDLDSVTVLGTTTARTLSASDCLFTKPVTADRRQAGCVRFSYVPTGSQTPRRHRCEPEHSGAPSPSFTSERYGDPGFAQLAGPAALSVGASDGAEMGAFRHLRQAQREQNLRTVLDEYLPAGLDAGIVRVT
jgi:hypothetical protein